jgi:hypothetical protein
MDRWLVHGPFLDARVFCFRPTVALPTSAATAFTLLVHVQAPPPTGPSDRHRISFCLARVFSGGQKKTVWSDKRASSFFFFSCEKSLPRGFSSLYAKRLDSIQL